jgi:hypothetical protein
LEGVANKINTSPQLNAFSTVPPPGVDVKVKPLQVYPPQGKMWRKRS